MCLNVQGESRFCAVFVVSIQLPARLPSEQDVAHVRRNLKAGHGGVTISLGAIADVVDVWFVVDQTTGAGLGAALDVAFELSGRMAPAAVGGESVVRVCS